MSTASLDTRGAALGARAAADGIEVTLQDGRSIALPEDTAAACALVSRATREGAPLVPFGLGSKLDLLRPELAAGEDAPLFVSTAKLDAVVSYVPGDGTLTAQAGATMDALARTVAEGGHRLTPDVARASDSTLGGVVAGGVSGIDRLLRGPVRHHVLGARCVQADGKEVQSGGRLVKNVTGYDLHRLWAGSRGTLGLVTEVSLRLFPLPELELCVRAVFPSWSDAMKAADALRALVLAPLAVVVEAGATPTLHVCCAGLTRQVRADGESVRAALEAAATSVEVLEGEAAAGVREALREGPGGEGPGGDPPSHDKVGLRLTCLPSRAADALATTETFFRAHDTALSAVAHPWLASIDLSIETTDLDADTAADLADRLAPAEVRVAPLRAPLAVHEALAGAGAPARASAWMRALRRELDPSGTFASTLFPYPAAPS